MSYFIIIRGPLGSGKTTLAKKLAEKLDARHIEIDKLLEKSGLDKIDEKEGCIPAENFIKAQESILPETIKDLRNNKIVIFDGCFYHKQAIDHLIDDLQFKHYIFTLKLPLELCIKRDSKRGKSYGRQAAEDVHKLVSSFDSGADIDASGTIDNSLNKILPYLNKS